MPFAPKAKDHLQTIICQWLCGYVKLWGCKICKVSKHILKEVANLCYFNPGKKTWAHFDLRIFCKRGWFNYHSANLVAKVVRFWERNGRCDVCAAIAATGTVGLAYAHGASTAVLTQIASWFRLNSGLMFAEEAVCRLLILQTVHISGQIITTKPPRSPEMVV